MNGDAAAGTVRLGLIGDNIARSQSPRLHELAGRLSGISVSYERLVPRDLGEDFETVFEKARHAGFRGLNITYPYKERVVPLLPVNTVVFTEGEPEGYNTDWSGFMAAYARVRGEAPPGAVCMVGAGGVGKAVAFGLMTLGLRHLTLVERELPKAEALAWALRQAAPALEVRVTGVVVGGTVGAAGLVNCTPVGMVGHDGTPVPRTQMAGAEWVFDAVYTPVETEFLTDAAAEGLQVLSGWELYFYQGLHAYEIFHGQPTDEARLRATLTEDA